MRCVDVRRELARPGGESRPEGLAEHLAGCPRCSDWAEQAARLDRLWEATRPAEPSPAVWKSVWARVCAAADATPARSTPLRLTTPTPTPARPWRRAAIAGLGIAQAAAILLGAVFLMRQGGPQAQVAHHVPSLPVAPAPAPVTVVTAKVVEIEFGSTVIIQSDPRGNTIVRNEPEENSNSVDWKFDSLGYFEAIAN